MELQLRNRNVHWRGIYESAMTRETHTHPGKCLGLLESLVGNTIRYRLRLSINKAMWKDLEEGIIRQGNRENVTNDRYKENNPTEE